jgi:hypothetical protein
MSPNRKRSDPGYDKRVDVITRSDTVGVNPSLVDEQEPPQSDARNQRPLALYGAARPEATPNDNLTVPDGPLRKSWGVGVPAGNVLRHISGVVPIAPPPPGESVPFMLPRERTPLRPSAYPLPPVPAPRPVLKTAVFLCAITLTSGAIGVGLGNGSLERLLTRLRGAPSSVRAERPRATRPIQPAAAAAPAAQSSSATATSEATLPSVPVVHAEDLPIAAPEPAAEAAPEPKKPVQHHRQRWQH